MAIVSKLDKEDKICESPNLAGMHGDMSANWPLQGLSGRDALVMMYFHAEKHDVLGDHI